MFVFHLSTLIRISLTVPGYLFHVLDPHLSCICEWLINKTTLLHRPRWQCKQTCENTDVDCSLRCSWLLMFCGTRDMYVCTLVEGSQVSHLIDLAIWCRHLTPAVLTIVNRKFGEQKMLRLRIYLLRKPRIGCRAAIFVCFFRSCASCVCVRCMDALAVPLALADGWIIYWRNQRSNHLLLCFVYICSFQTFCFSSKGLTTLILRLVGL